VLIAALMAAAAANPAFADPLADANAARNAVFMGVSERFGRWSPNQSPRRGVEFKTMICQILE
jgi:hypothetical protein